MLNLLNKGFKSTILNMFKELKEIISTELNKSMRIMPHKQTLNKKKFFF